MAALSGIRVLELAGLAPSPFAGMILADFGAIVTRVDKAKTRSTTDTLARGKRSISIDLQNLRGRDAFRKLCKQSDVLIEPFRPGVMEKLGLEPKILMTDNPRLIYARLTGYGQSGSYAKRAGHDINYLAICGLLSKLGRKGEKPTAPINLLGDFAGGGLMCAFGILLALFERSRSGKGQVVDAAMVDGAAYIGSFIYNTLNMGFIWQSEERGANLLDTGAPFYDTYRTADGKFMSVGAIEPKFYQELLKGLQLGGGLPEQYNVEKWPAAKEVIARAFLTKTRSEWCEIFDSLDACVAPVLTVDEAPKHPHNKERKTFMASDGSFEPTAAPKLSRTPADGGFKSQPDIGEHTVQVLQEAGYSRTEIQQLLNDGVVDCPNLKSSL